MSAGFVHLHVHSEYSVLDGQSRVKDLVAKAKAYNMSACALTDHGALFGAIDFYQEAKKAGIKPIIGCELYLAHTDRFDKSGRSSGQSSYHFLVLCENETGYHNLCRLSSLGYLEGYHYRPRVDFDLLREHKDGLIATSSCLAGQIPRALMRDDLDTAKAALEQYLEIFGTDRFLIEMMDHGMPEDRKVNPLLADLASEFGLMTIATNDVHYTEADDAEAHDALLAIQTGAMVDETNRFRFPGKNFYFASPEEMREKFAEWPEAVANTEKVAERCNIEIPLGKHLIPQFHPPDGIGKLDYLRQLVHAGLKDRYGDVPQGHLDRADYEIGVINDMGFVDYFLVVWDFIDFARRQGIPVGPGRGSGAGSVVAYALGITNLDPMRYGLLFERFLNPERVSMPDFDIDFCYQRRDEVIGYVRNKYGADNVSQIITFGRMLAKKAVRDVGRVLNMPYADVDRIAKLIPEEAKITLKDAYDKEPELQRMVQDDPQVARLWKLATRLEGTIGNCGTHAAGVVICDQPLTDHVALFKASNSDTVATQAEMKNVEAIGLLKMDFLGLRTLTVVHEAVRLIRESKGIAIDIDAIEPDDAKTYQLLRSGQTMGVFQLESSGMRDLAKRIGLESLEEICALVALYRPGPMKFIDRYVECKFHPEKIKYEHPLLEPILKETYGVPLYQEQIMQMVQSLAGFSLGQADIMRRAMGKKKADLMAEQRAKFVDGCAAANNIDKKLADELFSMIEDFAGYGFNKSHSMAYAFVAYQTAFLKANYPAHFMAALLTSESDKLDKIAVYIAECRRMGIEVLPPDVNESDYTFTVTGNGHIRFALAAIKNVGEAPAKAIVHERKESGPYADLFDFCRRLDSRQINRRLIESLNKAGAFVDTGWGRSQVEAALDSALSEGQISQRERAAGQFSLLDLMADAPGEAPAMQSKPDIPEWTEPEILAHEKEMLGLYVSSHPLAKHGPTLERYVTLRLDEWDELREGQEVVAGGLIRQVKSFITKSGRKMAFLTLETLEGSVEITVFADVCEQRADLLLNDTIVLIPSRVSYRNDAPGLLANDVLAIEEAETRLTRAVHVRVVPNGHDAERLEQLAEALGGHAGDCDVYLHCDTPGGLSVTIHAVDACRVQPSAPLKEAIENVVGLGNCWYSGGNGLPAHAQAAAKAPAGREGNEPWRKKKQA